MKLMKTYKLLLKMTAKEPIVSRNRFDSTQMLFVTNALFRCKH